MFPCTVCDKVFVAAGLLKMHTGKFHTDRGSHGQRNSNNVDDRSEEDAPSSTSNGRRAAPGRESVGESHGEPLRNNEELQERSEGCITILRDRE